jgi:hypothetical protein
MVPPAVVVSVEGAVCMEEEHISVFEARLVE